MSERRILITGGAGFIGYHLAKQLAEEDADHITLLDNFSRGRSDDELRTRENRYRPILEHHGVHVN